MIKDWSKEQVLVTGGHGFLGQHVVRELARRGVSEDAILTPRSRDFALRSPQSCVDLLHFARPTVIFHLAAKVGGIGANRASPGEFFYDNLVMGAHLMEAARHAGVKKYVQVGTVCAYPKHCKIPFDEHDLWEGYPEETNAPYGIAKKALLVQAQAYRAQYGFNAITLFPTNLYGPHDNFDPVTSHVIPALIHKFDTAIERNESEVTLWGSGRATRDFLFVEDCARGLVDAAERYDDGAPMNLGSGVEYPIGAIARKVADLVGYKGTVSWDTSKPDGQPRRRLSTLYAELCIGWSPKVDLDEGLQRTVKWYQTNRWGRL